MTFFRTFVRNAATTEPTTAKRVAASALFLKRTRAVAAETVHFVALLIESRVAWCRPEGPGAAEAEAEAEAEGEERASRRLLAVEVVVVIGTAARAFSLGAALMGNREPLEARDCICAWLSFIFGAARDEEGGEVRAR